MTQISKALKRLEPWLPLRENASFSGAFDAVYSGAHADVVTLWQDALAREEFWQKQKQDLDGEWGAQPESSPANYWRKRAQEAESAERRFFDPLQEKVRELESEKAQLEAALAREKRKTEALSEKVDEWFASAKHWRDKADQAQQDRNEAQMERSDALAELAAAEKRRDDWERSYDCLLEVQNKDELVVTKHDIEKAVADWVDDAPEIVNEVWSLVSGADPAVYVVRESDLPKVATTFDGDLQAGAYTWTDPGELRAADLREKRDEHAAQVAAYEAVARAIEAERAVDPVEAKAIELHQVAYGGRIGFGHATLNAQEMFRSLARHVLGQEAGDE